jgi:hypothetical protein
MCSLLGSGSGTAIIAVIGTLGGAALAGGFTYWQQKRQREHEDLVRFHQVRLDAYDKFYSGVLNVVGSVAAWHTTQQLLSRSAEVEQSGSWQWIVPERRSRHSEASRERDPLD